MKAPSQANSFLFGRSVSNDLIDPAECSNRRGEAASGDRAQGDLSGITRSEE